MEDKRWNPYVLLHDEEVSQLWSKHFKTKNKKVLYILGKGFDVRMNLGLRSLLESSPDIDLTCLLIELVEGKDSSSHNLIQLVEQNFSELKEILSDKIIIEKNLKLWSQTSQKKKVKIGDREASNLIPDFDFIKDYTDIIVDISALSRGVYFSLIGKILSLLDKNKSNINLFIKVAENFKIDELTKEKVSDSDLNYLHGFSGGIEIVSDSDKPLLWFPILGENKISNVRSAYNKISENKNRLFEICPVLPFPSKNPRRSDSLLIEYHELLFDELGIEPQNIIYIPERNPFEAYILLSNAIKNYKETLNILNGCKTAISNFSSKLLSIGVLLVAFDDRNDVGILNTDILGYDYSDVKEIENIRDQSELFVIWLNGEAYEN